MSKLKEFLDKEKIDTRAVLAASKRIERLRPEDRVIKMAKKLVKKGSADDKVKEAAGKKGRSGKKVARPLLAKALDGKKLSGPQKTRITRAINDVLKRKKKSEVTYRDLF